MDASQDFTAIAAGTEVLLEGFVAPCPVCGRNAIAHHEEAGPFWVHRQTTAVLCDGMRVDFDDVCMPCEEPGLLN